MALDFTTEIASAKAEVAYALAHPWPAHTINGQNVESSGDFVLKKLEAIKKMQELTASTSPAIVMKRILP